MSRSATESELWFDEYVRLHRQDPGDPEPDLGVGKNPDRLITWNGHEVVCEIKQFESSPFFRRGEGAGGVGELLESEAARRNSSTAASS